MLILVHPCIHIAIRRSVRPSIYPSDLTSIIPSLHTGSHAHRQGHACTYTCTHTFKSINLSILCQSVHPSPTCTHAHSGTYTFEHAHIYAYMHAYSPGPVAQLAARQICNLSSIQGSWYRTDVQPNNFRGDWSWDSFYSHSLSTAQLSLIGEVCSLCMFTVVLVNCLGGLPGNCVCRLTDPARHYLNSVGCKTSVKQNPYILMAKTHAHSGFNGWHILSSLVLFWQLVFKSDRDKLINYFTIASKNQSWNVHVMRLSRLR